MKIPTLRLLAVVAVLALAGTVAGTVALARSADAAAARLTIGEGLSSCPAGYVCLWPYNNFTGTGYAFYNSEVSYAALPAPFNRINDYSWSFYNHGNTSDIRFFRFPNHYGDHFVLCRGHHIAELPPNSDVDPPTGEPGRGWRDEITGHKFERGLC